MKISPVKNKIRQITGLRTKNPRIFFGFFGFSDSPKKKIKNIFFEKLIIKQVSSKGATS